MSAHRLEDQFDTALLRNLDLVVGIPVCERAYRIASDLLHPQVRLVSAHRLEDQFNATLLHNLDLVVVIPVVVVVVVILVIVVVIPLTDFYYPFSITLVERINRRNDNFLTCAS